MKIKEIEQSIPGELRKAKRRITHTIENANNHKMMEIGRTKNNDLYMALFFWEKYHLRKRTHDFYTKESQLTALETILDYLGRI